MPNKKRHIYSKRKEPYVKVEQKPTNLMDRLSAITGKKNIWSEYISRVVYNDEETEVPIEESVVNIVKLIKDEGIKKKVIKDLMSVKEYNPFTDVLPVEQLPEKTASLLKGIRSQLVRSKKVVNIILNSKPRYIFYQGIVYKYAVVEKNEDLDINRFLYKGGIDIVITYSYGEYIISTNPNSIIRADLYEAYLDLIIKENDTDNEIWKIHKNYFIIFTKNGAQSKLTLEEVIACIHDGEMTEPN